MRDFYIVGGDRDYLQICRRLRENLKTVYLAGFEKALSADLREYVGEQFVVSATRCSSRRPTLTPPR